MLSNKEKKRLYSLLLKHIPFGIHSMNTIAQLLTDHGITGRRYGYSKLKLLLNDLPEFLTFIHCGDRRKIPSLHFQKWEAYEKHINVVKPRKRKTVKEVLSKNEKKTKSIHLQQKQTLTPDFLIPVSKLDKKAMEVLTQKMNRTEAALPMLIEASYQQAKATNRLELHQNVLRFEMDFWDNNSTPLILTFKRQAADSQGCYMVLLYVDDRGLPFYVSGSLNLQNPARNLEQFAFLGNWDDFLNALAEKALPEDWDFSDTNSKGHYILKKYIQYTFFRLQYEEKICITKDRRFAAFNTGLVDAHYDDIYACFIPNNAGNSPWLFKEFAVAGQSGYGKQIVSLFNPLPLSATYFTRKEDLLFDLHKDFHVDYNHILIENIKRFPIDFYRQQLHDYPKVQKILRQLKQSKDDAKREQLYDRLTNFITDNIDLYNRLKNRLNDAVTLARKQIHWNFRTAIPSYYPSRNTMNLMLPLHLTSPNSVDNVLVVELTNAGNYQCQTILTMEQAYIDARLVASPQANWLTTSSIIGNRLSDD